MASTMLTIRVSNVTFHSESKAIFFKQPQLLPITQKFTIFLRVVRLSKLVYVIECMYKFVNKYKVDLEIFLDMLSIYRISN
jgi:hypothetical protein